MTTSSICLTFCARKRKPGADASAPEAEIDRHIYALYPPSPRLRRTRALTPAEIKIVEEVVR